MNSTKSKKSSLETKKTYKCKSSNDRMKKLGFQLESENSTTKSYVRRARAGVEVCVFMEYSDHPHFFWQRKRGMRQDTVIYDVYEEGMIGAMKQVAREKKWKKNIPVETQDDIDKKIVEGILKKLRKDLANESLTY